MKTTKFRPYNRQQDYERINKFLVNNYILDPVPFNWSQPRWEYMHFHSQLDEKNLNKIGIWEDNGEIVAVVHYEDYLGDAYFELNQKYNHLKEGMLNYAEKNLYKKLSNGRKMLQVFVNEKDEELLNLVKERKYVRSSKDDEPVANMELSKTSLEYSVPKDFKIQSLADENDIHKVHRVMHRGFNHEGEPPEDGLAGRKKMQSPPNFNKALFVVAVAPDGNYVSFAGSWYDKKNKFCYIEPVATDPDYRMMGLGKACVLETIKRCQDKGATIAIVGSGQDFYKAIGFKPFFKRECWMKYF